MTKQTVSTEMTDEQIANYARELKDSTSAWEESLGCGMWNAIYASRNRVSNAIRYLNGRKGESVELDQLIDTVISHIRK